MQHMIHEFMKTCFICGFISYPKLNTVKLVMLFQADIPFLSYLHFWVVWLPMISVEMFWTFTLRHGLDVHHPFSCMYCCMLQHKWIMWSVTCLIKGTAVHATSLAHMCELSLKTFTAVIYIFQVVLTIHINWIVVIRILFTTLFITKQFF